MKHDHKPLLTEPQHNDITVLSSINYYQLVLISIFKLIDTQLHNESYSLQTQYIIYIILYLPIFDYQLFKLNIMQKPQTANIKINLGSNKEHPLLADINLKLQINKEQAQRLKKQCQIQQSSDDIILCLMFGVQPGRQKQCCEYFQKGLDQQSIKHLSPLQKLLHRPKSTGRVKIIEHQQRVDIVYIFYKEYLQELEQLWNGMESVNFDPKIQIKCELKGRVSHHKKNRTGVKVQYAEIQLKTDICLGILLKFLVRIQVLQQQQLNNPFVKIIEKLKEANINLSFESFRKLRKLYKKLGDIDARDKKKSFPYVTKGLIKDKAKLIFVYKDKLSLEASVKYHSEDIFMRLVKIYSKFTFQLFGKDQEQQDD